MNAAYRESVAYLFGLQRHGIRLGLDTVETLLDRLGRPDARYPSLHIGGTNGKGSTAAMAAAMLREAGYRVGLYTSPHLVDYRERIRVNGRVIGQSEVVELVRSVRDAAAADLSPTFFEFNTAMAFKAFADARVDVAVVEVGMGGRFDATNVLRPLAAAVTTVALDHQDQLGHTVDAIAFEKAGIVKPGIPLVSGRLDAAAEEVVGRVARERRAPHLRLDQEFRVEGEPDGSFAYCGRTRALSGLTVPLPGRHQLDNAACALALIETAAGVLPVADAAIRRGLRGVEWEGRLEIVERNPLVVLDGAHNPAAAEVVAGYAIEFRRRRPGAEIHLVVGMMRDKDLSGVLARLCESADSLVLTRADMPRAATVEELRAALPGGGLSAEGAGSVAEALELAKRRASPGDLILVTGSLMVVGEVKASLRGCHLSPISG
jgi:dihydrofolate synthase/folylpolyglutamate synthase